MSITAMVYICSLFSLLICFIPRFPFSLAPQRHRLSSTTECIFASDHNKYHFCRINLGEFVTWSLTKLWRYVRVCVFYFLSKTLKHVTNHYVIFTMIGQCACFAPPETAVLVSKTSELSNHNKDDIMVCRVL